MNNERAEDKAPPDVTAEERWIADNRVSKIEVEYRQTGTDTAETYLHLTSATGKKVCWLDTTFNKVARLSLGYNTLADPNFGVVERVRARKKYELQHAADLATYRRLKAKFESA